MIQKNKSLLLLFIPLLLSSYTHLWNPTGFPDVFFDEGIYMRRAMNVVETGNPQEGIFYDHPYFGQLFLGGIFKIIGFPDSSNPSSDVSFLEELYKIPRILMGILAIVDTFLIYKITEKKFGKRVAFLAAILFAVMPMSWFLRRILLDSILLPFALSSILCALYSQNSKSKHWWVVLSGICLGLAIFTKIPIFTMMPLIGFLIFSSTKKIKYVGLWIIPVFLIPLIWPLYSMSIGEFDYWINDVLWQAGRESGGLGTVMGYLFQIDFVLMSLGIIGIIFAFIKREKFIILWFAPMMIFFGTIGFLQYFHWIPLIPIMCIAIALMINELIKKIPKKPIHNYVFVTFVVLIGIFGLSVSSYLINSDASSAQFESLSFVLNDMNQNEMTILASPVYSWILDDVFEKENVLVDYAEILQYPIKTENILLIADPHFKLDFNRGPQLENIYNNTKLVKEFTGNIQNYDTSKFPNGSYNFVKEGELIEIKINR